MGRRTDRPVRRTVVFGCAVLLVVTCGAVAGFFGFLGAAIDPRFLAAAALVIGGGVGIGCWAWRELGATDRAMAPIEETVLLDLEAIARFRPPTAVPHPIDASWWKRARRRLPRRVKEGAHR